MAGNSVNRGSGGGGNVPSRSGRGSGKKSSTGSVQGNRVGKEQGASAAGGSMDTNTLLKNMLDRILKIEAQLAAKEQPNFTQGQLTAMEQGMASGMSDEELQLMALRFKRANDLLDKNSEFYKKLENKTIEEYITELQKKVEDQQQAAKDKKLEEVNETMKRFAAPAWYQALQIGLNGAGEIASAIGNNSQDYRGNLAQALLNAANTGTPGLSSERAAAFGDPRANTGMITTAKALKQQHIGNRNKAIGDTINRITKIIGGRADAEYQQQRQLRTLLELDPTNEYYRTDYGRWRFGQQAWKDTRNLGF